MNIANYLVDLAFGFFLSILILRIWLQLVKADYYNPFSQFIVKVSNPLVVPLRRVIPGFGGIDLGTVILILLVASAKFIIVPLINGAGINLVSALILGVLYAIKQTGVLLFIIMLVMAIMSWVVQSYHPMHALFHQLSDPILKPIRTIVPTIGGLDLSILVAFILLNVLNMFIGNIIPVWRVL